MKTPIELITDLFKALNISAVTLVAGEVFKFSKPDGYNQKCIVINTLGITGAQLQKSIVNVNIHAPNKVLTINSQPDNSQADVETLAEIKDVVIPIIKDLLTNNTATQIENISLIPDEEVKGHFLNIRLLTNSINL